MRVFKTKEFARFARKARLRDPDLLVAAADVAASHWDADLGGGVFKQRVAREGGGKSGGYRMIIVFRAAHNSFFVHGFAKNDKATVTEKEMKALKMLARTLLALGDDKLRDAQATGEIVEIVSDGQETD